MSYENAPATRLLATHCGVCTRPLLDAVSVEMGIGPDCRKKYMPKALAGAPREEANKIVHQLALAISEQRGTIAGSIPQDVAQAVHSVGGISAVVQMLVADLPSGRMLYRLRDLGFDKLADKLEQAWITIRLTEAGGTISLVTPYDEQAVHAMCRIHGRRWDKANKVNTFPSSQKDAVWRLLQKHFAGAAGVGPKGFFVVTRPLPGAQLGGGSMRTVPRVLTDTTRTRAEAIQQAWRDGGAAAVTALIEEHEMQDIEAAGDRAQTAREEAA
jgi:hypothetical protein